MASLPPKTSVKRKKYSFGFSSDNPFVASASSGGDHLKRRPVVRRKSKHKTLDNNEISAIAEKDSRNQMRYSNNRAKKKFREDIKFFITKCSFDFCFHTEKTNRSSSVSLDTTLMALTDNSTSASQIHSCSTLL